MDADLALALLAAAGGPLAPRRALLEQAGDAPAALRDRAAWTACGLDEAQQARLRQPPRTLMDGLDAWRARPGTAVLGWDTPDYPPALRDAPSPPIALFTEGDPTLLWRPAIAVVGTRAPTPGGRAHAAEFAQAFVRAGFVVGSGLAAGIDAAAHAAALAAGGGSFGVLGTGPNIAYPASNADLQAQLAVQGAVASEHPPGTRPRREHFPSRNRLLAALCVGTVVIEAAERSGALITARLAAEAGREVFALPGSVRNPMARGCHRLIREGAALVETPGEVVAALAEAATQDASRAQALLGLDGDGPMDAVGRPVGRARPGPVSLRPRTAAAGGRAGPAGATGPAERTGRPATGEHRASPAAGRARGDAALSLQSAAPGNVPQMLWAALGHDPTGMDELAERTGLTPLELSPMLLAMELDGRVAQQHGRYVRLG